MAAMTYLWSREYVIALILVLICFSSSAYGDLVIETENRDTDASPGWIYVKGSMLRMSGAEGGKQSSMIFRGDKNLLWIINDERKEYVEMTKESLKALSDQMNDLNRQMKTQMAGLPPAQRKMMEQMMQNRLGVSPAGKTVVKQGSGRRNISGYPCREYAAYSNKEKIREYWVTDPAQIPEGETAVKAFARMGEFYGDLISSLKNNPFGASIDNPFSRFSKIQGLPVLTRSYKNGAVARETIFKTISNKKLKTALFEPPKGYKKKEAFKR